MKQTAFLLLLFSVFFLIFSLFADMSSPEQFLNETGFKINNENAVDTYNGVSYFVFIDNNNEIKLGKTTDWVDFEITFTWHGLTPGFEEPVIRVKNENEIYIAYNSFANNEPQPQAFLLKTTNGGDSFSSTQIGNRGTLSPLLNVINDEIEITCFEGWQESLAKYDRYTNFETSENVNVDTGGQGIMAYWGTDVLYGPVHSNDDIWIRQLGGGDNNNWPTFHGFVSTTGRILVYPGGQPAEDVAPMEEIFRGGWAEEVAHKQIAGYDDIRANGTWLFSEGDYDLCYVILNGASADVFKGIINSHVEEFPVYSWYPAEANLVDYAIANNFNWFEDSEVIATNYVTIYDTTWVATSIGTPDYSTFFVPSELWIRGEVAGNQTWGASEKVRITGDITYFGTDHGDSPDGFSGVDAEGELTYDGSVNANDFFGLLSEKSIYVAYKSYSPDEAHQLETFNVEGGENNHVYLYGSYAALAQGDESLYGEDAPYYDGQFTFEYQHPHGSTPAFRATSPYTSVEDTLYKYIDLHKFILPTDEAIDPALEGFMVQAPNGMGLMGDMAGYPSVSTEYAESIPNLGPDYVYPLGTDYPWYNPVWPESVGDIVTERGTLHVFGSIAQTRKGFTHRSGSDPANHPDENWDLDNFHFAGTHPSTGYNKDYNYDRRLKWESPNNFPYIINDNENKLVTYSSSDNGETFSVSGEFQLTEESNFQNSILLGNNEWKIFISNLDDPNVYFSNDNWNSVTITSFERFFDFRLNSSYLYFRDQENINKYDLNLHEIVDSGDSPVGSNRYSSILIMGENPIMISLNYDEIEFAYSTNGDLDLSNNYTLPSEVEFYGAYQIKSYKTGDDELVVFIDDQNGPTLFTHGTIEGLTDVSEEIIPTADFTLTNFPNPFNPSTEIRFTAKDAEDAKIEIYNIKGQRIREFKMENVKLQSGSDGSKMNKITWNGTDQNNHSVSSGIYYYTLKLDGKVEASRKMVLLK